MAQSTDLIQAGSNLTPDQLRVFDLFEQRRDTIEALKSRARSPRTLAGYTSDWRQFRKWCKAEGLELAPVRDEMVDLGGAPVMAEVVALWIADSLGDRCQGHTGRDRCVYCPVSARTVSRRMAAVKFWHKRNRLVSPTNHPDVEEILAGVTRADDTETGEAEPISGPQLVAMLEGLGKDLRGKRDRALLLLGYFGAFRRSELVGLDVSDVTDHDKGIVVRLRRSKTDQSGKGRDVHIAYQPRQVDPVRALREWLKAAQISEGPIFRGINGHVSERRLTARTVSRVVKQGVERLGLDPARYSAHSLRAGHVSWAVTPDVGAPKVAIRATTGHKTDAMTDHYSRVPSAEAFDSSSSAYMAKAFDRILSTPLAIHDQRISDVASKS